MADNDAKFTGATKKAFQPGGTYSSRKNREKDDSGDFLMPAERKYPFKINGKISCKLVRAAMSRAGQNGETEVSKKAHALFEEHCG